MFFMPLGGGASEKAIQKKVYEMIFTGSLLRRETIEHNILLLQSSIQNIIFETKDFLLYDRTVSVEEANEYIMAVVEVEWIH